MTRPAPRAPVKDVLASLERAIGPHGVSSLDPRVPKSIWRRALTGPAEEFLARPGKELRAALVRAGARMSGMTDPALVQRIATVIELLHAGSLVIDDVEDESKERRGAPALHELIGVPLAINTGSWMYFWALAEIPSLGVSASAEHAIFRRTCATLVRCHQGQALDLAVRVTELSVAEVPGLVDATTSMKTGALCGLATSLCAVATGAPDPVIAAAARFGESTGKALQMLDDLGSLTSAARRAKGLEDLRHHRPTWPWAWLAETAPSAWADLVTRLDASRTDAELAELAVELADTVGEVGRLRIRGQIDDALADLLGRAGDASSIAEVGAALTRMEMSYG